MAVKDTNRKIIVTNRRARHEYHILDTYEAGLVLKGTEVKSLREGKVQLADCYGDIIEGELFLINMHISPYSHGNRFNHDPKRPRKLLMHRKEINKLVGKINERGFTLIPLTVYFIQGKAKVEIALCRGKKAYDKRESIKNRDLDREQARIEKEYRVKT